MASRTRDRVVQAMASLVGRHGFAGTGLKLVAAESGAPFGSIYHHFPGGKEELAAEALRWSAAGYAALVQSVLDEPADDAAAAVRHAFEQAGVTLAAIDFTDACPVATVALEVASSNDALRQVTAEIFEGWLRDLDRWFAGAGATADQARQLSTLLLASLEGGFLLSRAARDATPLALLGTAVAAHVATVLGSP